MTLTLAFSAKHLSLICPERSQLLEKEASKLQSESLKIFNDSMKEITSENIIPTFLFSGLLGLYFFADTFSKPSENLEEFLDRLIQSIRLMRGVRAILGGWWDFLLKSEIKDMLLQGHLGTSEASSPSSLSEESISQFEQLCERISASNLDPIQSQICITEIRQIISILKSEFGAELAGGVANRQIVTTWPVIVSAEFTDLLTQRKPEALIILAYFSVLLHLCREFWIVGNGGRLLLDTVMQYLGSDWGMIIFYTELLLSFRKPGSRPEKTSSGTALRLLYSIQSLAFQHTNKIQMLG